MIEAIAKEIKLTMAAKNEAATADTIYFGGGTPSLLSIAELQTLLQAIYENFVLVADAEITLEANPDDVFPENLAAWKAAGINRFSLGVQSFQDAELKWMNRAHNAGEALQSIDFIQQAGFNNFSVDLIYGSPLLTDEQLIENVNIILQKDIPHVSAYALTVEPRTALLHQIEKALLPRLDEAKQARQFTLVVEMLNVAGYEHYEISNFARPGFRSKHNSSYWKGTPYFGFGPSAHSYNGQNERKWNVANNIQYLHSLAENVIPHEAETLTEKDRVNERIMIALRTIEGLDLEKLETDFGKYYSDKVRDAAMPFIQSNKLQLYNASFILTPAGKFFADGIAANLFVN